MQRNLLIEIDNLNEDSEIEKFIEERKVSLEKDHINLKSNISKTTKYIPLKNNNFNEERFYSDLVKNIKMNEAFNLVDLFNEIYYNVNAYSQDKEININGSKDRALLTHDSFKFLGFDSQYITGNIRLEDSDEEHHAYTCVFPMGYANTEFIFLYDPSFTIDFIDTKNKNMKKIPAYTNISEQVYKNLLRKETSINFDKTAVMIAKLIKKDDEQLDVEIKNNYASYTIGDNKPQLRLVK